MDHTNRPPSDAVVRAGYDHRRAILQAQPELQDFARIDELLKDPAAWHDVASQHEGGVMIGTQAARRDPNAYIEYAFDFRQHSFHLALQSVLTEYPLASIDAPVEHGKSTQLAMRALWELGNNVSHQVAFIGSSTRIPYLALGFIRSTIESNERSQAVFPWLKLERANSESIVVERPKVRAIQPSVVAMGIMGSILGGRFSIIILDDILSQLNVLGVGREKVWNVLTDVVMRRRLHRGRLWDIGTPWFDDDARHKLRRRPGFVHVHFDAEDGQHYRVNADVRQIVDASPDAQTLWDDLWRDEETGQEFGFPKSRLEEVRRELTGASYQRQLRCRTLSSALAIFPVRLLDIALGKGRGQGEAKLLPALPGIGVLTGVDLATRRSKSSHRTVMTTGQAVGGRFIILDIRSGHWEQGDIARQVRELVQAYPQHAGFNVEDNSAQVFMVQILRDRAALRGWGWSDVEMARLRVEGFNTNTNKHDEHIGVRAMVKEFEAERIELPSDNDALPEGEVQELVSGLMGFDPDPASHTSDHVMSLWLFLMACRSGPRLTASGRRDYGIGSTR